MISGVQRSERAVLATLADASFIEPAKQLFSSAYFNGGWRGDYLLLAHAVPDAELRWFEERGILVRRCEPLFTGELGGMSAVLTSKFNLFRTEMRRWRTVVYCDADALVRSPLDDLCDLDGFWSVLDVSQWIRFQILTGESMRRRGVDPLRAAAMIRAVHRRLKPRSPSFCAGFFAFTTDLIDDCTFDNLIATMERFHVVSEYGDQLTFNLFFADQWRRLPPVYNVQVSGEANQWGLDPEAIDGIVLHYITPDKPWRTHNAFFDEWRRSLERADAIDLSCIPRGRVRPPGEIEALTRVLLSRDTSPPYARYWVNSYVKHHIPDGLQRTVRPIWRALWRLAERGRQRQSV